MCNLYIKLGCVKGRVSVRCPKFNCGSEQLRTVATREDESLPQTLQQYNLKRRRRACRYGHRFFTVEIIEADFEQLVSERGRLEPIMPGVRGRAQSE